ncbi:HK97 family phage prohead protease [Geoglobus acetivorans]|uniref:HK97 family phage prohead protease n=1 Tax=Geoglobus acetivorans TaxID=565033 RepID=A0ABZ3H1T4_GEOAI|nr:HK97 family phage prohead protease [Geoglobus acetivorans]
MELLIVKSLQVSDSEKNVYVEGYASAAVKDLDDEIITEEALKTAAEELKQEPYNKVFVNHKYDDIPIGKIVDAAVKTVDGVRKLWIKVVLNKAHPMFETVYRSLKDGFLDAFSIGFKALERAGNKIKRLKILEVSLVGIPANPEAVVDTVYEKMFRPCEDDILVKGVVPGHPWKYGKDSQNSWKKPSLSDFTDKSWDELSDSEKRSIAGHFAWSPKNPPEKFTDLKLPHHDPKTHAVVWRGVVAAMAALMGARGGIDIPSEDRKKVYDHLAAHYKEFGNEPPEFRFLEEFTAKLVEATGETDYGLPDSTNSTDPQPHLKSPNSKAANMSEEIEKKVEELTAEIERLKAENEELRKRLAEYEEKEKVAIIEKIKRVAAITKAEVNEEELKKANVIELKLVYADLADRVISHKTAEKVKTPVDNSEGFIETKWGRADARKVAELRKMLGIEGEV